MAEPHAEQSWLWRMRIDLTGEIPEPVWPAGIRLHGFRTIDGRRLHALLEHGYRRGGGSVASFETWMPRLTRDSEFDPDLCFLVEANDELVAAALCWTSAFAAATTHASCMALEASNISPPGSSDEVPGGMPEFNAFIRENFPGPKGAVTTQIARLHTGSHEACDEAFG